MNTPHPKTHRAKTTDMYGTFFDETYPRGSKDMSRHAFDFLFTKGNRWFYMSSDGSPEKLREVLAKPVEERRQKWRVVEYHTGRIVLSSK